jgi:tetratricopeptide (TPR) repeat protein
LISVKPLAGRVLAQGLALDEPMLAHRTALQQVSSSLTLMTAGSARSIAARAGTLVDQAAFGDERTPWALLERGLALAALGHPAAAEACYRTARATLKVDEQSPEGLGSGESADSNWYRWVCFLLGSSILSRDGDLNEATSALRTAQALAPDDAACCLYLAEAIQRLVERESFAEVSSLLNRYLELGAPYGRLAEIEQRINSLTGRATQSAYARAARS